MEVARRGRAAEISTPPRRPSRPCCSCRAEVLEKIKPMEDKLQAATGDLKGAIERLEQCKEELDGGPVVPLTHFPEKTQNGPRNLSSLRGIFFIHKSNQYFISA